MYYQTKQYFISWAKYILTYWLTTVGEKKVNQLVSYNRLQRYNRKMMLHRKTSVTKYYQSKDTYFSLTSSLYIIELHREYFPLNLNQYTWGQLILYFLKKNYFVLQNPSFLQASARQFFPYLFLRRLLLSYNRKLGTMLLKKSF